ncbi:MAG TPA: hypothetical protein VF720_12315 [Candidatus Eisenbacteria bacterium]
MTFLRFPAPAILTAAVWLLRFGSVPEARAADADTLLSLRPASGCAVPELPETAYVSPPNRRRLLPIVFDNAGEGPLAPRSVRIGAQSRAPGYAWFDGVVRDRLVSSETDPLFADLAVGHDATMVVAVDPPDSLYTVGVGLGDPLLPRGPVDVVANDSLVAAGVSTTPGERRVLRFRVPARHGRIAVRFIARSCHGFGVSDLAIEGPSPSWLGQIFPPVAPVPDAVPPTTLLPAATPDTTRAILRRLGTFLVAHKPQGGGWSSWGLWYQTAFAVRGVLSAGLVLDEPAWREAAFATIDRFVAEQSPAGTWSAGYVGADTCAGEAPPDTSSTNLADVGSMVLVLSLAAPDASPERREAWLAAARRYSDQVVLPEQLPDGAFPNRRWMGKDFLHPYTVATATQCSQLMTLGAVTGEARYTAAAEKAAAWLTAGILPDGRVSLYPHDSANQKILESIRFGDAFYLVEALVTVRDLTRDVKLKDACRKSVERWLTGPEGIKSKSLRGYWWAPMDMWTSSKMAGVPWILARDPRRGGQPIIDNWLDRSIGWLADPMRAQLIGIGAHPASTRGEYALTATGFAAMGVAAALDPAVLKPGAPTPVGR